MFAVAAAVAAPMSLDLSTYSSTLTFSVASPQGDLAYSPYYKQLFISTPTLILEPSIFPGRTQPGGIRVFSYDDGATPAVAPVELVNLTVPPSLESSAPFAYGVGRDRILYWGYTLLASSTDSAFVNQGGAAWLWRHNGANWQFVRRASPNAAVRSDNLTINFGEALAVSDIQDAFLAGGQASSGTLSVFDPKFETSNLSAIDALNDPVLVPLKPPLTDGDYFGCSGFFLTNEILLVGSRNRGFYEFNGWYDQNANLSYYEQRDWVPSPDPNAAHFALRMTGFLLMKIIVVSAPIGDSSGGRAFIFSYNFKVPQEKRYALHSELVKSTSAASDGFGTWISMHGSYILMSYFASALPEERHSDLYFFNVTSLRFDLLAVINFKMNVRRPFFLSLSFY